MTKTISILHISDLHADTTRKSLWRRQRVLGESWDDNIVKILEKGPVDIICFTGDLAFSGLESEYSGPVSDFTNNLLELTGVPIERLYIVPGNHDIDRNVNKSEWEEVRNNISQENSDAHSHWLYGGSAPPGLKRESGQAVLYRQKAFRSWLMQKKATCQPFPPPIDLHNGIGYRETLRLPRCDWDFHVIGLDSAWLAGDDNDQGKLWLTEEQVGRLTTDENGNQLHGFRLALMHHSLFDIADAHDCRRILSDNVDILLHGHHHRSDVLGIDGPVSHLSISSTGCLYGSDRYPNACTALRVDVNEAGRPLSYNARFRVWSKNGHWFDDDSLTRFSEGGVCSWVPRGGLINARMMKSESQSVNDRTSVEDSKIPIRERPGELLSLTRLENLIGAIITCRVENEVAWSFYVRFVLILAMVTMVGISLMLGDICQGIGGGVISVWAGCGLVMFFGNPERAYTRPRTARALHSGIMEAIKQNQISIDLLDRAENFRAQCRRGCSHG